MLLRARRYWRAVLQGGGCHEREREAEHVHQTAHTPQTRHIRRSDAASHRIRHTRSTLATHKRCTNAAQTHKHSHTPTVVTGNASETRRETRGTRHSGREGGHIRSLPEEPGTRIRVCQDQDTRMGLP
eukprot:2673065-Rhodomonas_salina.1